MKDSHIRYTEITWDRKTPGLTDQRTDEWTDTTSYIQYDFSRLTLTERL